MSTKVVTQNEIEEARKKFSEMYSNVKLGGKGLYFFICINIKFIKAPKKEKNLYKANQLQFKTKKSLL